MSAHLFPIFLFYSLIEFSSSYPFQTNKMDEFKPFSDGKYTVDMPFNNVQVIFCVGFLLVAVLGIVISLRLTIYRMYFWRKQEPLEEFSENTNSKYKPVVCIHGLLDCGRSLHFFADVLQEKHPGTSVEAINVYNGLSSLAPLWKQVEKCKEIIEKICADHPEGIHLIGVSQGALLSRGVLETSDKHNVDTFISIAGPHMGQFGIPILKSWLPGYKTLVKNVYRFFYTGCFQKLSVPEYWKDPNHLSLYVEANQFLPILNNEKEHPDRDRFKRNFSRVRRLVLIGGPDDGFIKPWQSSHFGYCDVEGNIVEMRDQDVVYKKDSFGLRTLDEKQAITTHTIPNLPHYYYVYDVPTIEKYILPHLN